MEQYTVTQIANVVENSVSWVNYIRRVFVLPWGPGQKGKRGYYTEEQLGFFVFVADLQKMGVGIKEMKTLCDADKTIMGIVNAHYKPTEREGTKEILLFITGGRGFIEFDFRKYSEDLSASKKSAVMLQKVLKVRQDFFEAIQEKLNTRLKMFSRTLKIFSTIVGVGGELKTEEKA